MSVDNEIRMFMFEDRVFFFEKVTITIKESDNPINTESVTMTGDLIVPIIVKEKMRLSLFLQNIDKGLLKILDKELTTITTSTKYNTLSGRRKIVETLNEKYPLYKHLVFDKKIAGPLTIMYNAIMWFVTITMRKFNLYSEKTIPMIVPGVYDSGTREPMTFMVPIDMLDTFIFVSEKELEATIKSLIKKT